MFNVAVGCRRPSARDIIIGNYRCLIENIYPNDIIDTLIEKDLLKSTTVGAIQSCRENSKAADFILKDVIRMSEKDSTIAESFLDILEENCDGLTRDMLRRNLKEKNRTGMQISSVSDVLKTNIISNTDIFVDRMDPDIISNIMFEYKALGIYEHDQIICHDRTSFRAKALIDIVTRKRYFSSFLFALENSGQKHLLQCGKTEEPMETEECIEVHQSSLNSGADQTGTYPDREKYEFTEMEIENDFETRNGAEIEGAIIREFNNHNGEEFCEVETYTVRHLDFTIDEVNKGSLQIRLNPLLTKPNRTTFEELLKDGLHKFLYLLISLPSVRAIMKHGKFKIRSKIKILYRRTSEVSSTQDELSFLSMVPYIADTVSRNSLLQKLGQNTDIQENILQEFQRASVQQTRPTGTLMLLQQIFDSKSIPLSTINASLLEVLRKERANEIINLCPYCVKHQILENFDFLVKEMDIRTMTFFCHVVTTFHRSAVGPGHLTHGCRMQRAQRVLLFALRNNFHVVSLAHVLIIHGLDKWLIKQPCSKFAEGCSRKQATGFQKSQNKDAFELKTEFICSYSNPTEVQMRGPQKRRTPSDEGYCSIELVSSTTEGTGDTDTEPFVIVDYSCYDINHK